MSVQGAAVLVEVGADLRSVLRGNHCASDAGIDGLVADPDLALVDLIGWRDALATVALQAVEGVLTQLRLALLVRTFYQAGVVLLDTGSLHPIGHLQEKAGTLRQRALLPHDALTHGVGDRGRPRSLLILGVVQARIRLENEVVMINKVRLAEDDHIASSALVARSRSS